jgi:ribosomal protein S5
LAKKKALRKVFIKPALQIREIGVIAGGSMRACIEAAGNIDVLAKKVLICKTQTTTVKATVKAFR